MAGGKQVVYIASSAGLVVIAGIIGLFLLWRGTEEQPFEEQVAATPVRTPTPRPTPAPRQLVQQRLEGLSLTNSDELVRELARGLSSHPKYLSWLAHEDLIRRVVASVDNIANGKSPRQHLEFLRPKESMKVREERGDLVIDPASYERYNRAAGIFSALDTEGLVTLYWDLKPLIDEAYREIAPPGKTFESTLFRAIDELQQVPIVTEDIYVKEKVVTYVLLDDKLEGLSDAQRHFLRMGPQNVGVVKSKLNELESALTRSPQEEDVELEQ